jgi:hypothetical protein
LRLLGIDTKTDHCAHGFRTTFSTLSHHEEIKDEPFHSGIIEMRELQLDAIAIPCLGEARGPPMRKSAPVAAIKASARGSI